MSLLFLEGFDQYDSSLTSANLEANLKKSWGPTNITTGSPDGEIVAGRHGGQAINGRVSTQYLTTNLLRDSSVEAEVFCGFAFKLIPDQPLFANAYPIYIMAGDQLQFSFRINQSGTLDAYRSTNAFLATSPTPIFQANMGWGYLEFRVKIHDTVGSWTVKLDGVTVWDSAATYDTRVDSQSVYWDSIRFFPGAIALDSVLDDIYICDSIGAANNTFLGDVVVENINPTAEGDTNAWTPSTGVDNSALVDEAQNITTAGLSETDYVDSNTPGDLDLYQYANLSTLASASAIHGVQVNTWRRITAEQPMDLIIKAKTGTTEADITETVRHDDSAPVFQRHAIFELDPDTAVAWTPSGVNGAQFGVEVG